MASSRAHPGDLEPVIPSGGPELTFDFPAIRIGVAEYPQGPTGCTVFQFPAGAALAVDVRGGSPGYIGDYPWTDAICLAGGSIYGLESVVGISSELLAQRDYATGFDDIALVSGAIIYDFRPRDNAIYPDKALGQAALRAAQPGRFPLGPRGAGSSATVGKGLGFDRVETAGQGGAFRQIGQVKVAVFTVVNAVGAIVDRQGRVVRGHLDRRTGVRAPIEAEVENLMGDTASPPPPGNTTLTVVVTNQALDQRQLRQIGRQVHASMARAIQPFHTISDGDVLFTVTTAEVDAEPRNEVALAVVASELAWDAVLTSFAEDEAAAANIANS